MKLDEILQLFFAGLALGNGPCLVVCLPVLLPYIAADAEGGASAGWKKGLGISVLFSVGRIAAYALLGGLSVAAYRLVSSLVTGGIINYVQMITGILVLAAAAAAFLKNENNPFCRAVQNFTFKKVGINMIIVGFLIGIAPCWPLYGALGYLGAMSPNILWGFAGGVSFGFGTVVSPLIPLGILSGFASEKALRNEKIFKAVRILSGIILLFFGTRLILISGGFGK